MRPRISDELVFVCVGPPQWKAHLFLWEAGHGFDICWLATSFLCGVQVKVNSERD